MSRTILITGGTHGIGRALARHYDERGDRVIAVGSRDADLSSLEQTRDLAERVSAEHPVIDALVLGAFRYHPRRIETEEGFEATFALYVLSRRLLAVALRTSLERAGRPVIVNLCGTGPGRIHWDDLQLTTRYRPLAAITQGARANALLGAAYASERTRYVLYNPVFVATGLHRPFKQPVRGIVRAASALFAQPPAEAVPPIAALIDDPPAGRLTAYKKGKPVRLDADPGEARRFEELVRSMTDHARRCG
ncbi:SDR family NAD(P)-dependent oxidoreductase [Nonomuraea sp. B10E15]|uniref:SDR family NAD(P)-dependent oxidoreductase n=1 Tax=Nonomuraea sp. B10E15 TaxID=3153560 RepID=UPI00325E0A0D